MECCFLALLLVVGFIVLAVRASTSSTPSSRWEVIPDGQGTAYVCANCGFKRYHSVLPHCPQCGEEMPWKCPGCGYILRGLDKMRCPECGMSYKIGRLGEMRVRYWTRLPNGEGGYEVWKRNADGWLERDE